MAQSFVPRVGLVQSLSGIIRELRQCELRDAAMATTMRQYWRRCDAEGMSLVEWLPRSGLVSSYFAERSCSHVLATLYRYIHHNPINTQPKSKPLKTH